MISLEEVKPFAEGGNRVCYIHPNNKSMCLKISKPEVVKKMRSNAPWYKKLRSEKVLTITTERRVHISKELLKKTLKKYGDILQNGMNL